MDQHEYANYQAALTTLHRIAHVFIDAEVVETYGDARTIHNIYKLGYRFMQRQAKDTLRAIDSPGPLTHTEG